MHKAQRKIIEEEYTKNKVKGIITFASRMKRLSELLFIQVQNLYDSRDRDFKASWFAILATIKASEKIDFKTLANENNISSSAVSQTIRELETLGLVDIESGQDRRSRFISLTKKGHEALEKIKPDIHDIEKILLNLMGEKEAKETIKCLEKLERELRVKELKDQKFILRSP